MIIDLEVVNMNIFANLSVKHFDSVIKKIVTKLIIFFPFYLFL